jgi:hypothetical protein
MKEQVLSGGDRAALQGLVALAGTLGIGALLARLMPSGKKAPDRRLGFLVFEVSSVVAILTAAGMTAYSGVLFLHQDQAISDGDLTRVGTPLVVSLTLLVLLVAVSRFAALPGGLGLYFPNLLTSVVIGATLGLSVAFLELRPVEIVIVAAVLLAVGACFGWFHTLMEGQDIRGRRRDARKRATDLVGLGYRAKEMTLQAELPTVLGESGRLKVPCWTREGRIFLDQSSARQLASEVNRRWTELAAGNAVAPAARTILADLKVRSSLFPKPLSPVMTVSLYRRSTTKPETRAIEAEKGVFKVTGLGVID